MQLRLNASSCVRFGHKLHQAITLLSALYGKCPYYLILYMESVLPYYLMLYMESILPYYLIRYMESAPQRVTEGVARRLALCLGTQTSGRLPSREPSVRPLPLPRAPAPGVRHGHFAYKALNHNDTLHIQH